jgi:integrase
MDHASSRSRTAVATSLKLFFNFLSHKSQAGFHIESLKDLTFELVGEFAQWLERLELSYKAAANYYRNFTWFLKAARRLYPIEFNNEFEIPKNCFPNVRSLGHRTHSLTTDAFEELLRTADIEATKIEKAYKPGSYPTRGSDLIPFMILIAGNTAINSFSLYDLRRDCIESHPIDEQSAYMRWEKKRSSKGFQRQIYARQSRTIELLEFVRAFTEPLVAQAKSPDQALLFLYEERDYRTSNLVRVVSMHHRTAITHLEGFCEKHNLFRFRFNQIRPTAATNNYLKNGRDVRKTQMLLGHKSVETTLIYINSQIVGPFHTRAIREAQTVMLNRITVIASSTRKAVTELSNSLSAEQTDRILKGDFSTGFCNCRDPLNSPQPGQRKGHICTLFLACLSCPNALYFLEDLPRVIALRDHLISIRDTMNKQAWADLYEDSLKILNDDIIGAFSEKQIAEATVKAAGNRSMKLLMAFQWPKV